MSANQFKDAQILFKVKSLELPELIALQPNNQPYQVMAIQPSGLIAVRDDFIGNADQETAKKKFAGFFALASESNAELVLAPEYSCPWDAISAIIKAQRFPAIGNVWIIGCESITPQQLTAFIDAHPDVVWLHEEPLPNGPGHFFGALCYLLKTKNLAGQSKDVVIIQFKRQAMSDKDAFERDHLITGKVTHFLRNPKDNIRLLSLICSESLVFKPSDEEPVRFDLHPYIVFHPQLNLEPRHPDMKAYRRDLFAANYGDRIEVISLNWARGFQIPGKPASAFGGSAVFMKSSRFRDDDNLLNGNHSRGLYYTRWQCHRSQLCLLNFDEHIFHFRTQKVYSTEAALLFNRTGPEMLQLWKLDRASQRWADCAQADDGFVALCDAFDEGSFACCLGNEFSPIDRERLLALSTGKLQPAEDWFTVGKLNSFTANEDECPNRLLFAQDKQPSAVEFRRNHLGRYIRLHKNILADANNFPLTIADLKDNYSLCAPSAANRYRFNLVSKDGAAQGATAVFIGQESPASAKQLRERIAGEWGTANTRRLVVWYEHDNKIKSDHSDLPGIMDDSEHPASIARSGAT